MSRARNIKPSFFMNEELGELPFEARLFFIGLWCLCDPEGKMEFRPKRVKAELFPYDDVDCTVLAQCLHSAGLIRVYTVDDETFIWVPTFIKHQTPHMKEKPRGYPDYSEGYAAAPDKPSAGTVQAQLNPESGYLNPDVLNADVAPSEPTKKIQTKASKSANPAIRLSQFLENTGGLPPAEWADYPRNEYNWTADRLNTVWRAFSRYWNSPDCKKPLKRDWYGTWQNWCDREATNSGGGGKSGGAAGGNLAAAVNGFVARRTGEPSPDGDGSVPDGSETRENAGHGGMYLPNGELAF